MSFDSKHMNHTPPSTFLKREFSHTQHSSKSTSPNTITGRYELDFTENKRSATLRSKLAAHIGSPAQTTTQTKDGTFSSGSSNNSTGISSRSLINTARSNTRKRKGRCFGLSLGPPMRASMKEEEEKQEEEYKLEDSRMSENEETIKERIKHVVSFNDENSPYLQQRNFIFPNMIKLDSIENKENMEFSFKKNEVPPRPALAEKPINIDTFRKPKIPKSIQPVKTFQPQITPQVKPSTPVLPAPHVIPPVHVTPPAPESQQIPSRPLAPATSTSNPPKRIITINGKHYEKLELVGRGGSSKVYRVKSLSNGLTYAIKKVSNGQYDETYLSGFKGEIDLLIKLRNSDRVVQLIDHAITAGSIYLVMERGEIDFAQVLTNKLNSKTPFDLDFIRFHSLEMLRCVKAVHDSGIVHSDLKPANFLFVKGILKIIDFGIANAVPEHTMNIYRESQIGTPNYMAPEALTEINHAMPRSTWKVGKPSDIWSIGCIIYQLIYGRAPYANYSGINRMMAITDPRVKIEYPNTGVGDGKVPETAIELMKMCLKREPNERWTVDECLSCDFLCPKIVTTRVMQDVVHQIMDYGHNRRINNDSIGSDEYDDMVDLIMKKIANLNYK